MRVLAWVHLYPPDHCAGAEMMLHEILTALTHRGHTASVLCDSSSAPDFESIPVHAARNITDTERGQLIEAADIVITHLDRTRQVTATINRTRPIVHLVHNDRQLAFHRVRPADAQLAVMNSNWLRKAVRWNGPTIVVPPPVDPTRYQVDNHDATAVTLINLSPAKGSATFWALAEAMPHQAFIGVIGGYGPQPIPTRIPPNVTIVAHGPHIRDVYRQTRILICPSDYESWGRVGVEAMASGIPVIAHPTPGLLESLRGAGTFVDRDDTDGWIREITTLTDPDIYTARSRQARLRSTELDPTGDLDRLEQAMLDCLPKTG